MKSEKKSIIDSTPFSLAQESDNVAEMHFQCIAALLRYRVRFGEIEKQL